MRICAVDPLEQCGLKPRDKDKCIWDSNGKIHVCPGPFIHISSVSIPVFFTCIILKLVVLF